MLTITTQKLENKLQYTQNKCVAVCLNFHYRTHAGAYHFRKINWLPVKYRVEASTVSFFLITGKEPRYAPTQQ